MYIEQIKQTNTQYLGKEIIYYNQIDSTQDEAKRIVEGNVKNGTIILADTQTKGRGTKGRKWYTKNSGNIAMTIILYPNCNINKLQGLTMEIAKCMVIAINQLYGYVLDIKEPNDLMLNGKKIGGILTETAVLNENVKHILIGIGFNVNELNFDEEICNIVTSLKLEYNIEFSVEKIIIKFLEIFEQKFEERLDT